MIIQIATDNYTTYGLDDNGVLWRLVRVAEELPSYDFTHSWEKVLNSPEGKS